jgi:hypothetical protein
MIDPCLTHPSLMPLWRTHSCVQRSHFPETLHPRIDSEALVGRVGNLRPIGNRPVLVKRTAYSYKVSGPRDAPEGTVFRSCERSYPEALNQ